MCSSSSSSRRGTVSEQMFRTRAGHGVQSALSQQRVNNRRTPATGPGGVLTLRYRSVPLFNLPRGGKKRGHRTAAAAPSLQGEPEAVQSQVTPAKTKPKTNNRVLPRTATFTLNVVNLSTSGVFLGFIQPNSPYKAVLVGSSHVQVLYSLYLIRFFRYLNFNWMFFS